MAISKINTRALSNDSVTADKVADNAITTEMISSGEVGVTDLADGAITNAKISASAAIDASKVNFSTFTHTDSENSKGWAIKTDSFGGDGSGGRAYIVLDSDTTDGIGAGSDYTYIGSNNSVFRGDVSVGSNGLAGGLKIGASTVIDSSRNISGTGATFTGNISGTGATFTEDVAINNGSPELYFGTTGNHYNWRLAAQELLDAAFEVSVGTQDNDYTDDTYSTLLTVRNTGDVNITTGKLQMNGSTAILNNRQGRFNEGTFAGTGTEPTSGIGQLALHRSNGNPFLSFHGTDGGRVGYIQQIDGGTMYIASEEDGGWTFHNGSGEVTTISDGGLLATTNLNVDSGTLTANVVTDKVGIGTANPFQKLTIVGRFNSDSGDDYYGAWGQGNSQTTDAANFFAVGAWYSSSMYMQAKTGSSNGHIYTHNATAKIQIQAGSGTDGDTTGGGRVQIGPYDSTAKLSVGQNSLDANDALYVQNNPSTNGYTIRARLAQSSNNSGTVLKLEHNRDAPSAAKFIDATMNHIGTPESVFSVDGIGIAQAREVRTKRGIHFQSGGYSTDEGLSFIWNITNSSNAGTTWRKVATIYLADVAYAACGMEVDVHYFGTNFGYDGRSQVYKHWASFKRAAGAQNNAVGGMLSGPSNNYLRITRVNNGEWELQARAYGNNQSLQVHVTVCSQENSSVVPNDGTEGVNLSGVSNITPTAYGLNTLNIDGNIRFAKVGSGVEFQSFGSGTNISSNTLSDYEEGTWTPTVYGQSTAGTMTQPNSTYQTTPYGYYTKIGNRVIMTAHFAGLALSGASGFLRLGGLPFTFANCYGWATYLEGFDPRYNKTLGGSYPAGSVILRGSNTSLAFGPSHTYAWDAYLDAGSTLWNGGGNGVHGSLTIIGYVS